MVHELVFRCPQLRVAGAAAPARGVDQPLRVLDAEAHRKRFALHRHALGVEHRKAVAGAMAHGHHHLLGGDEAAIGEGHAANRVIAWVELQPIHTALECDLAPEGGDLRPQASHHRGQLEGADVGMVQHQDLGIGACRHQLLKHLAAQMARIAHLAVELAVGKGAGAAFAELGVGLRVERAFALPEAEGIGAAFLHRFAALQQQGLQAHLGQQQGAEVAAGAGTHHHRPGQIGAGWCLSHQLVGGVGSGLQVRVAFEAFEQTLLLARLEAEFHAVGQLDVALAAGIHAALHHPGRLQQQVGLKLQAAAEGFADRFGLVVERQLQFVEPQHRHSCSPVLHSSTRAAALLRVAIPSAAADVRHLFRGQWLVAGTGWPAGAG